MTSCKIACHSAVRAHRHMSPRHSWTALQGLGCWKIPESVFLRTGQHKMTTLPYLTKCCLQAKKKPSPRLRPSSQSAGGRPHTGPPCQLLHRHRLVRSALVHKVAPAVAHPPQRHRLQALRHLPPFFSLGISIICIRYAAIRV